MEYYKEYDYIYKEIDRITKEQTKIKEGIQSYEHKKNENEMVQKELDLLDEDDKVYKLIGPVLIEQDLADAKLQVKQRLSHIGGELKKLEQTLKKNDSNIATMSQKGQEIQNKIIELSKQIQAKKAAEANK